MSTISVILVRKIYFSLFVISLFFFLINLPPTYSYFTSKAEADELVLETGLWEFEVDMTFDQAEPSDQLGMMSDHSTETLSAEIQFPDKADVRDIDLNTLELDYLGDLIMPVAGSEQYVKNTLILQFDLKELAKLLEGTEEGDVLLTLRGSGKGFSFTAVGKLPLNKGIFPLRWADEEELVDEEKPAEEGEEPGERSTEDDSSEGNLKEREDEGHLE